MKRRGVLPAIVVLVLASGLVLLSQCGGDDGDEGLSHRSHRSHVVKVAAAPAPSPPRDQCAASSSEGLRWVKDRRDPWGGCFPGPRNTGVPAGTPLTPYTGPCRITEAGTVIDSKRVDCILEIFAKDVQVKNSLVRGSVWTDDPEQGGSFTITDSTVDAGPVDAAHENGLSSIGKSHFTALRVETRGGIRGVWCEFDCTVQDSWIHGQDRDESGRAHQSGIRQGSGATPETGQRIIHNTIVCDAPDVPPDGGCSADITGYGDFAPIRNNVVRRNLLESTTGEVCAYAGAGDGGKPFDKASRNNRWIDNIFRRGPGNRGAGPRGHCGVSFGINGFDPRAPGNVWHNNRWDTGEVMPSDG